MRGYSRWIVLSAIVTIVLVTVLVKRDADSSQSRRRLSEEPHAHLTTPSHNSASPPAHFTTPSHNAHTTGYSFTRHLSSTHNVDESLLPTEEELSRGLALSPPLAWGLSLYAEKSLRVMSLGGSNTENADGYTAVLEELVLSERWWPQDVPVPLSAQERVKALAGSLSPDVLASLQASVLNNSHYNHNSAKPLKSKELSSSTPPSSLSYLLNEGISGHGPTVMKYRFEDWDAHLWPNLVTLEYFVNCPSPDFECMRGVERVMHNINHKYAAKGLAPPLYLFLELFRVETVYKWRDIEMLPFWKNDPMCQTLSDAEKEQRLPGNALSGNLSWLTPPPSFEYHTRGANNAMHLMEYARFYRYPIISARDALFPSFVRFFATHSPCARWPLTKDGPHLSVLGTEVYVNGIIKPFLHEVVRRHYEADKKNNDKTNNVISTKSTSHSYLHKPLHNPVFSDLDVRFFPRESDVYQSNSIVYLHRVWGPRVTYGVEMRHRIITQTGFVQTSLRNRNDGNHNCLGSSSKGATILFDFSIPDVFLKSTPQSERAKMRFSFAIGTLHSWDTSYVGDIECNLYRKTNSKDVKAIKGELLSPEPILIQGSVFDGQPVRDSTPRITKLGEVQGSGNGYVAECRALDNRLACFTMVAAYYLEPK